MRGQDDFEALCRGRDNGNAGRLVFEGLPPFADAVQRALAVAGFELARIGRGIGRYPVAVHTGRNSRFWLVANDATTPGAWRPVYQATAPDGPPPANAAGYYDLRALFRLRGESEVRAALCPR